MSACPVFFWLDMSDLDDATPEELEQELLNDATTGVEHIIVDGMSVRKSSLKDRMAVADRQKNATAAAQNHFGLRFTRLISPGGGGQ